MKSQALKGLRLILILSSVFGMVACSDSIVTSAPLESDLNRQDTPIKTIETPSGPRDIYDPTQIPRGAPLVFDETLNRAYEYFSHLKNCEDELELDKKDICLSHIKDVYGDLWGDNAPARRYLGKIKYIDPLVPIYASSEFKSRLTLHGLLDDFVINSISYFPSHIDGDLVALYLDHLENNDVIKRLPVRAEERPGYKVQSLESLRRNFPEFKRSEFMPKNHRAGAVLSGHEFAMFFGEKNSEVHEVWSTDYSASNCRRGRRESFFYKIKIGYESAWLREYMGGRNVATIHVCAPIISGLPQVTVFKLE